MSTNLSNYNIYVYKGNNFSIEVKYTDNLNIGIDLSNYTANMSIRRSRYDNELLTQVNENYPNGVINGGLSGDYEDGSGFSGLTGGLQLNYNGITGNIKIRSLLNFGFWNSTKFISSPCSTAFKWNLVRSR